MLRRIRSSSAYLAGMAVETFLVRDPDGDCRSCQELHLCTAHSTFTLVSHDKVPSIMRSNPYIYGGFRPPELTWDLCLKSLFQLNNETINIWSHLLGLIYFTGCQLYDNIYELPRHSANWDDHLICVASLLCSQLCMLFSACFHLFNCLSEDAYRRWLQLDLIGISMGLLGIYLSGVHYAFNCFPMWHSVWITIISLVALVTLLGPLHQGYTKPILCRGLGPYHLVYAAVIVYGVVPTAQWIVFCGGWHSRYVQQFLPNVVGAYGLCAVAAVFYLLMIPERWSPGKYDFIGASHQWWHIFILSAMLWWHSSGLRHLEYIRNQPDACNFIDLYK